MKAFNGDKKLKASLIRKLRHHEKLDTFIQGNWLTGEKVKGNGYKGCFYGCTMQTEENAISKFSEKYSVDLWFCYLTEKIFEGLPDGEYQKFPTESIEILPVGFDFNKAKSLFHYKLLEDQLRFCKDDDGVTKAINQCMELFKVPFDQISDSAARSAAYSACSAADSAADSAARSAADSACSAAYSAARSAADSAYSAARSAADSAARSAYSAADSAYSAAYSAADSAYSAAYSAADSACSAADSARLDYYIFMKDLLFECIKS